MEACQRRLRPAPGGRGDLALVCTIGIRCVVSLLQTTVTNSGTISDGKDFAARDRLLLAATKLLDEAAGGPVSTREITERAGVRAPTLYHHFGSKRALLDAVVSHGFKEFLRSRRSGSDGKDPLEDVRAGWDSHVAFGLEF